MPMHRLLEKRFCFFFKRSTFYLFFFEKKNQKTFIRFAVSDLMRPLSAFAALGLYWGSWAAALPDVSQSLQLSDRALGFALACAMAGAIPAMWLAGRAGNRASVPRLAPAVFSLGVACTFPAMAPNAGWLAIALAGVGAVSGTVDVLMNACVGELEAADGQRRMHLAHAVFSAGLFGSSVVAGLLRQAGLGYRPILALAASMIMMLALAARQRTPPLANTPATPPLRRPGLDRGLVGLGLLCGIAFILENGMELWSALYLNRNLHAQPAIAALGPGLLGLSAVAGRLAGQLLAGRLGDARLLAFAGLLAASGVIVFTAAPAWPFALPGLILSGSGISIAAPTFFGLAGSWAGPGKRGSAVSLVSLISYLGFLIGPLYLGAVSTAFGLRIALSTLAVSAAGLAVLGPWLIRRHANSVEAGVDGTGQFEPATLPPVCSVKASRPGRIPDRPASNARKSTR